MPKDILTDHAGAVQYIRFNRPNVRNAFRQQTLRELDSALAEAFDEVSTKVIVLCGQGESAFCAGADLKEMAALDSAHDISEIMAEWWRLMDRLRNSPKPLIAAVRGYAVGGGTEIALNCHIVISAESGRFGLPEIRRGHIPGAGGTVFLPRRIGPVAAAYYLLTGDEISAPEALRLGLVARVFPDNELDAAVSMIAGGICEMASQAVQGILATLTRGPDMAIDDAIKLERAVCESIRGTSDFHEGIRAFVEKRTPHYESTNQCQT